MLFGVENTEFAEVFESLQACKITYNNGYIYRLLDVGANIGTLGHFLKYFGIHTANIDLNFDALMAGRRVYGDERRNTPVAADGQLLPFLDSSFVLNGKQKTGKNFLNQEAGIF